MRDQRGVVDAVDAQELVDKAGLAGADAKLDGELDALTLHGLGFYARIGDLCDHCFDLLTCTLFIVQDQKIRLWLYFV